MTKKEFIKIANIIELHIKNNIDYKNCISSGYVSERFNSAWEEVKMKKLIPQSSSSSSIPSSKTPKYKRYLLTDFNLEKWNNVDFNTIKSQIDYLNILCNDSRIYGELGKPESLDVHLLNASHYIKNLSFENGKVWGDVYFLDLDKGVYAKEEIENGYYDFEIRSDYYKDENDRIIIDQIYTWDVVRLV